MATEADIGSWNIGAIPIGADFFDVFTASAADTLTETESVARRNNLARPTSETVARTDALVQDYDPRRALADTITLSDVATRLVLRPRTAADSITLTDTVLRDYDPRRSIADAVAFTDINIRDYDPRRATSDQWSTGAGPVIERLFPDYVRYVTHYNGPMSMRLSGASGNFASTPAQSAFNITDLDVRWEGSVDNWDTTPGSGNQVYLISNYGHLVSGFKLYLNPGGTNLRFQFGPTAASHNVTNPFQNARRVRIRLTRTSSDGVTKFFGSADPTVDWESLPQIGGSTAVSAGQTIPAGSVSLKLGSGEGATNLAGTVSFAEVRDSGNVVARFDASSVAPTGSRTPSTLRDATGELWTISGSAWRWATLADFIQDDPDSIDTNWLVDDGFLGELRVSFVAPAANLTTGAGLQEFRIRLRPG